MRKYLPVKSLFLWLLGGQSTAAWSPHPKPLVLFESHTQQPFQRQQQEQQLPSSRRLGEENGRLVGGVTAANRGGLQPQQRTDSGRRAVLFSAVLTATSTLGWCRGLCGGVVPPAVAAASSTEGPSTTPRAVYKSGKAPIVPGVAPRDKNDVKGTKKDPDFLRSISDCKSQCQSAGDGSYAKSKEDCLSECQDICCKTYEQCTFDIVPRI
jgi:hypothetical protein